MQFKDIEGQYTIANKLTEIIDLGRVSHAQLFLGDAKDGSLALAMAYVQYLFCQNRQHYEDGRPLRADSCGQCPSCKKIHNLSHSDLHLFFPSATTDKIKSNPSSADFQQEFRDFMGKYRQHGTINQWYDFLGVDNKQGMIREKDADNLVKELGITSYEGRYKVVIIWMADKMNITMANKILKNLEEPSPQTLIILVAESTEKILPTIISRTQLVRIPALHGVRTDVNPQYYSLFVTWMRQLFKLNMSTLSAWVDSIHALGREQQKMFLLFAQDALRECFLRNNANLPMNIDFGDEKFNAMFPTMITPRNIERLNNAFDEAIFAIERNAYAKIAFMQLSFNISKGLKNR